MAKNPPFDITNKILKLSQSIAHELGILTGAKLYPAPIKLRKENRIKTIQASLAIEGNTLTFDQVSAIFDGKKVYGPQADIMEVNNAIKVYQDLNTWTATSILSFKKAHEVLMLGLISDNGKWRTGGVGVLKGDQVAHMAPPAKLVPKLMKDLFTFILAKNAIPWLIKACIFHYELEFIHPFNDGNGRMGRLWQQLLLMRENPAFEFISVESIIKANQAEYYSVLGKCDHLGNSTLFVEFSLSQILTSIKSYTSSTISSINNQDSRLAFAKIRLGSNWFSRKEYINLHKDISTATASRDLLHGVKIGLVSKQGERNQITYQFNGN